MTTAENTLARARIDRLRAANPVAVDLAALCALAVRVEPELLRRLRLLLPAADVTAESDLWASDLLVGASPRGIALDPRVADELRTDLRMPRWDPLRWTARQLILSSHRELHWSLRLEEQINWHVVAGVPAEQTERLLLAAVGELINTARAAEPTEAVPPGAAQVGIARWLLGALARLPRTVAASDAASAAGLAAGLHLDRRVAGAEVRPGEQWLPWLLSMAGGRPVRVPVRFDDGRLEVNSTGKDTVLIELPATEPMVVDVDWHDGRAPASARLTFAEGERVSCAVGSDRVALTTLAGRQTTLSRTRASPNGLDFAAERIRHRPCLARDAMLDRAGGAIGRSVWTILRGGAGTGKTALACGVADRVEWQGWVVVQHFYGVQPAWDDPPVVAASLEAQLRAAFPAADWSGIDAGDPRRHVEGALRASSRIVSGPGVLVLVDGIPAATREDTTRWMFDDSPLPSKPPPGVAYLVTGRYGVGDWREGGESSSTLDLDRGADTVCEAMLDHHQPGLRAAFGAALDNPNDPPGRKVVVDLVRLAGGNPGRLARIVEWLLNRPAGSATLQSIPRSLTVRIDETWKELGSRFSAVGFPRWLAWIAVAADGLTVDDARRIATDSRLDDFLRELARHGLISFDGLAGDGATVVHAEPSVAEALTNRFGQDVLTGGHNDHVRALLSFDFGSASRYQVAAAVYHLLRSDDPTAGPAWMEAIRYCTSGGFLHRRACQDGVAAVLADLRAVEQAGAGESIAPIRRAAESVTAAADGHPERFMELLVTELRRLGMQHMVTDTLLDGWPPALTLTSIRRRSADPILVRLVRPVSAAVIIGRRRLALIAPGGLSVLEPAGSTRFIVPLDGEAGPITNLGDDVAVAVGPEVRVVAVEIGEVVQRFPVTSPVTALTSMQGVLVAGTQSGVVALIRRRSDSTWNVQLLAGHAAAVTALAGLQGRLLTASPDGTVRVWDLATGAQLQAFHHRAPVRHLVGLAPTGQVISADDSGRVCWWDAATGRQLRALRGHDAPVTALAAIDASSVVSAGRDGTVWRWRLKPDASGDRQLMTLGPALLGAGRVLVPGSPSAFVSWDEAGEVAWWDHDGRRRAVRRPDDVQPPIRAVLCDDRSEDVRVIHAGGLTTVAAPRAPDDPVEGAHLRQLALLDADTVVLGTSDGTIQHHMSSGNWVGSSTHGSAAAGLARLYDRTLLAAWADGTAEIWRGERGQVQLDFLRSPARLVAAADREGVVCEADGRLVRVAVDGSVLPDSLPKVPQATALTASGSPPDYLLVGDARGDVTAIGGRSTVAVANAGQAPVTAVAAAGGWCVVGTADGTVLRWKPDEPAMTVLGHHDGPVEGIAAVDGRFAASASTDRTVRLWDVAHGVEHTIVAGPEPFHAAAFAADTQRLFVRAGANALWLLDVEADAIAGEPENLLTAALRSVPDKTGVAEAAGMAAARTAVLAFELRCMVPCEITAAQLRIDAASTRPTPSSPVHISFDPNGRFFEPVATGPLAVPRRFAPGRPFVLWALQEFAGGWDDGERDRLALRVAFVTPGSRHERWFEMDNRLGAGPAPDEMR